MDAHPPEPKAFAIPNRRCTDCQVLLRKHNMFAKSSCRDCSHFPRTFLGFLVLELFLDLKETKKMYESLQRETQFNFECLMSLERRLSRLETASSVETANVSSG